MWGKYTGKDVAILAILLFVLIFALTWILVPAFYGLPSVPTQPERIRAALRLADLKPGEAFFDLGAGDGRTLVIAAREFEARATGIEVGPAQCLAARVNAWVRGVRSEVRVKRGNFYRADLRAADVVFVYATSRELSRLQKHLESQLRAGARVVSVGSDFPNWNPAKVDREGLLFLYVVPAQYSRTVER
jgi:precorrin-6B methylase 2